MVATVEALQAEVERLRAQLARAGTVEFLGESLPSDLVRELGAGGKLSPAAVKTRPIGMHGDGGNLWLQVTPGGRSWLFRYRWGGKQREMGLGSAADVPLAEARGRAAICRRLVRLKVDPIERRRATEAVKVAEERKVTTFRQAAERYIKAHEGTWKNPKHAAQWPATLKTYVYPHFGEVSVAAVDIGLVLKALEPIWNAKPETATRVRGRIEAVLDWATARGLRKGDNPARWRGHLDKVLPARARVQKVKHHAAVAWRDMNSFWKALQAKEGVSVEALKFTVLTGARTGETIGATWAEVDLKEKVWTVPPERMKAGKEHRVPLSDEAVGILERMKLLARDDASYVFPGAKVGKPLSNMAMAELLKDTWDGEATVHGFRSAFRDWASESTAYASDLVEMALAHSISNKVEAAYRRGDMFDKRRNLMRDWQRHCLTPAPAKGGNLRPIGSGRAS